MYKLNKLPYSYDSLEPFIDTHTLGLHHRKHQENYLNKLNELLLKNNYNFKYPIEELYKHILEFNEKDRSDILYNLGGVLNHDIYFNSMNPNPTLPNVTINNKIIDKFESFDNFKKEFKKMALSIKGSGYTFLVLNNGNLEILNFRNQDSPYFHNLIPLVTLDMWEHAYYLNCTNKKDIYIDNFFNVLDFTLANILSTKLA